MFLVGFFANPFSSHVLRRCICHQGYHSIKWMISNYINFTVSWWVMINFCQTVKIKRIMYHIVYKYSLKQLPRLHLVVSLLVPVQMLPPFAGRGLLHVLSLCLVPLPHVTLQSPYSSQGVQAPLTILEKSINIYAIYLLYIKNCKKI